ncbi:hypothetical protein BT96DRAFT_996578 [Gymnopus androsaceus JB14]|uniref:RING-type domain-containing protein n=1 Tax=Gymnopus androsaceus JB14 TaxID=1447944 RepID=A0A6A4HFQ5_9AGAR|nr:hypothetical protein BT96DRAFT_996578 [Gymnopus androsaceus JB14]
MRFSTIFSAAVMLCAGAALALPYSSNIEARSLGTSLEARDKYATATVNDDKAQCSACQKQIRDPKGLFSYCENSSPSDPHASCKRCMEKALQQAYPQCPECHGELAVENAIAYICPKK